MLVCDFGEGDGGGCGFVPVVLGDEEGGAGGADKGGGGMTGNALRLALREWEGVLNAVDGGA